MANYLELLSGALLARKKAVRASSSSPPAVPVWVDISDESVSARTLACGKATPLEPCWLYIDVGEESVARLSVSTGTRESWLICT